MQPRGADNIFANNSLAYSYHFIYEYLFVTVSTSCYEKDFHHRLKLFPTNSDAHQILKIDKIKLWDTQFEQLKVAKESENFEEFGDI
jgi:hypothetical protein